MNEKSEVTSHENDEQNNSFSEDIIDNDLNISEEIAEDTSKNISNKSNDPSQNYLLCNQHHPSTSTMTSPKEFPTPSTCLNNSSVTPYRVKTVFTKLTEQMFSNLKDNSTDKDLFFYDTLLNDDLSSTFSHKKPNNQQRIKLYNQRINKENLKRKYNLKQNKSTSSPMFMHNNCLSLNSITEIENVVVHPLNGIGKTRSSAHFLHAQELWMDRHEKKLEQLKEDNDTNIKKTIKAKPTICLQSYEMVKKQKSKKCLETENIHQKLYNDYKKKRQFSSLNILLPEPPKEKQTQPLHTSKNKRPMKDKDIALLTNKLYDNAKERQMKTIENELIQSPKMELISQDSVNILIQKLVSKYDIAMNNLFNAKTEDNISLSFNQFLLLLFQLGYTVKSYTVNFIGVEKEFQLAQNAWKILHKRNSDKNTPTNGNAKVNGIEEDIPSHLVLLFFLCVSNLYKGKQITKTREPTMRKSYQTVSHKKMMPISPTSPSSVSTTGAVSTLSKIIPFINEDEYSFDPRQSNQIAIYFRVYNNNQKSQIAKEKRAITNYKLHKNLINTEMTFQPNSHRKNTKHYTHTNHSKQTQEKTIEGETAPHLIRERTLQKQRDDQMRKELKECTFQPNTHKALKKSSSSLEISTRLYSTFLKKQKHHQSQARLNSKSNRMKTISPDRQSLEKKELTFSPQKTEYKKTIFKKNPLQQDKQVTQGIERYEKARIDRKVKEYLITNGYNSLNHLKTCESLLRELEKTDSLKGFRFNNEKKFHKESFEKYNQSQTIAKPERELLLAFEIKIENEIKTLSFYKGENISIKADEFCKENNLGKESKSQIIAAIRENVGTIA